MNEKTLQEVLKENKENFRKKLELQREKDKKEQIKENILFLLIAFFIMIITIVNLININNNFMNDCMSAGHSQQYCERGL